MLRKNASVMIVLISALYHIDATSLSSPIISRSFSLFLSSCCIIKSRPQVIRQRRIIHSDSRIGRTSETVLRPQVRSPIKLLRFKFPLRQTRKPRSISFGAVETRYGARSATANEKHFIPERAASLFAGGKSGNPHARARARNVS